MREEGSLDGGMCQDERAGKKAEGVERVRPYEQVKERTPRKGMGYIKGGPNEGPGKEVAVLQGQTSPTVQAKEGIQNSRKRNGHPTERGDFG